MLKPLLLAVAMLSMTLPMSAAADGLSIAEPTYTTPNTENGVNRPVRGMTMEQVEQRYGAAEQRYAAVGIPAITRWQYAQFDVYFEDQLVIHAVVRRPVN